MTIISHAVRSDVPVVVIDDELLRDDVSLQELYHEILDQVEGGGKKHLLLNLELVRGITSAGLNMLLRVRSKCEQKGTALHLCHLQPGVVEVLEKAKLCDLFRIHEDVVAGLGTIGAAIPHLPR